MGVAIDIAFDLLIVKGVPLDWRDDSESLPIVSEAYKRVIRLLSALDHAMGWQPMDWSVTLKTDRDLLAHLEEYANGPLMLDMGEQNARRYQNGMKRTLNEYDRLKSMEGME